MKPWKYPPGQTIRLTIDSLSPNGEGEGSLEGFQVLVRGALPKEEISAKVIATSRHRPEALAQLSSVEVASAQRVSPPCPHVERCGGCDWQHLSYEGQLLAKQDKVKRTLAHHKSLKNTPIEPCRPSEDIFGYRYVAKWVPHLSRGRVVLGAYARRSHQVITTEGCLVHRPPLEKLGAVLREVLSTPEGLALMPGLRYLVARESFSTQEIALVIVAKDWPNGIKELARRIAQTSKLASVVLHVNKSQGDAIFSQGGDDNVLVGKSTFTETIAGESIEIPVKAFLQINPKQAQKLRETALALAAPKDGEAILDFFSGVGEMSLLFAKSGKEIKVNAFELSREATDVAKQLVSQAQHKKDLPKGSSVYTACSDLSLGHFYSYEASLAYLNPPRAGASEKLLEAIIRSDIPRIVYTSCSPKSFARDAEHLVAGGYQLETVIPFDLFPQTTHVELVARFTKA